MSTAVAKDETFVEVEMRVAESIGDSSRIFDPFYH